MRELMAHSWPGNVRELRNVADRFVLGLMSDSLTPIGSQETAGLTLADQVDRFECSLIEEELRKQQGRVAAAAEALGVPKKTLYDKMRKFNLAGEEFR
jgi:two-component system C4-dicarboxylate transport response regulator DctD